MGRLGPARLGKVTLAKQQRRQEYERRQRLEQAGLPDGRCPVPLAGHCPITGKEAYATEELAVAALEWLQRIPDPPQRYYRCTRGVCTGWHLTRQGKSMLGDVGGTL